MSARGGAPDGAKLEQMLSIGMSGLAAQLAEVRTTQAALAGSDPSVSQLSAKLDRIESDIKAFEVMMRGAIVEVMAHCSRLERRVEDLFRKKTPSRPVLIRFTDAAFRDEVWRKKTSLKGTGFTVSEFLIDSRQQIFNSARRSFGMTKSWTRDGQIFVAMPDGTKHRIFAMEQLKTLEAQLSIEKVNASSIAVTQPKFSMEPVPGTAATTATAATGRKLRPKVSGNKDSKSCK